MVGIIHWIDSIPLNRLSQRICLMVIEVNGWLEIDLLNVLPLDSLIYLILWSTWDIHALFNRGVVVTLFKPDPHRLNFITNLCK